MFTLCGLISRQQQPGEIAALWGSRRGVHQCQLRGCELLTYLCSASGQPVGGWLIDMGQTQPVASGWMVDMGQTQVVDMGQTSFLFVMQTPGVDTVVGPNIQTVRVRLFPLSLCKHLSPATQGACHQPQPRRGPVTTHPPTHVTAGLQAQECLHHHPRAPGDHGARLLEDDMGVQEQSDSDAVPDSGGWQGKGGRGCGLITVIPWS